MCVKILMSVKKFCQIIDVEKLMSLTYVTSSNETYLTTKKLISKFSPFLMGNWWEIQWDHSQVMKMILQKVTAISAEKFPSNLMRTSKFRRNILKSWFS